MMSNSEPKKSEKENESDNPSLSPDKPATAGIENAIIDVQATMRPTVPADKESQVVKPDNDNENVTNEERKQ